MNEDKLSTEQLSAIEDAIRLYLQPLRERLDGVRQFVLERHHSHEVILLLCAYLDALATTILGVGGSSETRLGTLLETFSCWPRWAQVSLPDLYQLLVHAAAWPYLFEAPGLRLDPAQSALRKSLKTLGFRMEPDDEEAARRVLRDVSERLASLGRVMPEQDTGPSILGETKVCSALGPRFGRAFRPVIERFRVSGVLYRNFRCRSVHELHLPIGW